MPFLQWRPVQTCEFIRLLIIHSQSAFYHLFSIKIPLILVNSLLLLAIDVDISKTVCILTLLSLFKYDADM